MIAGSGIGLLVWVVCTVLSRGMDATIGDDKNPREAIRLFMITIILFALIIAGGISLAIIYVNLLTPIDGGMHNG